LDYFAISLLGVVFLYPAVYAVFLAVQVLRDSQWNPKERDGAGENHDVLAEDVI
jgi:hypothetical protein